MDVFHSLSFSVIPPILVLSRKWQKIVKKAGPRTNCFIPTEIPKILNLQREMPEKLSHLKGWYQQIVAFRKELPPLLPGQVSALLLRESAHKLLILAGQSVEESGDLLFHKGLFSPHQLKQILTEQVTKCYAHTNHLNVYVCWMSSLPLVHISGALCLLQAQSDPQLSQHWPVETDTLGKPTSVGSLYTPHQSPRGAACHGGRGGIQLPHLWYSLPTIPLWPAAPSYHHRFPQAVPSLLLRVPCRPRRLCLLCS